MKMGNQLLRSKKLSDNNKYIVPMSKKSKTAAIIKAVDKMRMKNGGVITYYFADGTKQSINVNPKVFLTESGGQETHMNIIKKFNTLQHDLGAIRYIVK